MISVEGTLNRLAYCMAPRIGTYHVRGFDIQLEVTNYLEYYRAVTYGTKEPDTLDWIERYGGSEKMLFDIGANIGLYSLYAALVHFPMNVVCFEPVTVNWRALQHNFRLNHVYASVHPYALSDRIGWASLNTSSLVRGQTATVNTQPGSVRVTTLDEIGGSCPTMLKIDVDGGEARILDGALALLRNQHLETVLIEITGDLAPIEATMKRAGLRLVSKSVWELRDASGQPIRNVVFAR